MSLAWSSVKALSIPVGGVARDVKSVSVGGVTLWTKPSSLPYDAEVECLESTGTQYIDTGVTPDATTAIDLRGVFSAAASETRFGSRAENTRSQICAVSIASGFRLDLGTGITPNSQWLATANDCTRFIIDATTSSATVTESGGTTISNAYASSMTFTGARPILVFAFDNGTGPLLAGTMRVSSLQITQNGVLVRDYIPVRVGSGANAVGCLYDRANPTGGPLGNGLYPNAGTGAFVVGPDAN